LLLILFSSQSCDTSQPYRPQDQSKVDKPITPKENREAEEAALWLSGELYAPDALYKTIKNGLAAIRQTYLDSIPNLTIEFQAWWIPSKIGIHVTEEVRRMILQGLPNPVDSLNRIFGATRMDTFRLNVGVFTIVYFEGRLHPLRLAEIYKELDGVTKAYRDAWWGDYSNVYPWSVDNKMTYLFRWGYGDCPCGCACSQFWYFRRCDGATEYLGTFGTCPRMEEPDWWDEAKAAYEQFQSGK
jgi:hypothetical protein